jgi:hypothetical protein
MGATMQNQRHDSAGRKNLVRQTCRAVILDQSRCIGKNWEGEFAIGNIRKNWDLISPNFLSGKIGSDRECRISISGIAIILQIFSQMPDSQFFVECPWTLAAHRLRAGWLNIGKII